MERLKNEFLGELALLLVHHPEKDAIIEEYDAHLDELLMEIQMQSDESDLRSQIYSRVGTPLEIADLWREELSVTPSNMKWLFIAVNILFFTSGAALTLAHNVFDWTWLKELWEQLTSIPILIAIVYMAFWALLGYEIGRGFGHKGKKGNEKDILPSINP